jgi:hypothetical protein
MTVTIERHLGRARLIACMLDPRQLVLSYNQAANEERRAGGEQLPLWSDELLRVLGAGPAR